MKDLRFIFMGREIENDNLHRLNPKFVKGSEYLPSSLRYMKWFDFPFSSLPDTFQGKNLVELDIHGSNIVQLWEVGEGKILKKLRFLRIVYSKLRTFDLRVAPNLEQLTIEFCDDFEDLHIPAIRHSKLIYLTLRRLKLTSLHLGNTLNLKKLILGGVGHLVEFQMPAESLKLEHLDLKSKKLTSLHLGYTPNLKILDLQGCEHLVELQMPAESIKLEHLDLNHSKLTNLHLRKTPNLKTLVLEGCNDLVELQMPAESLKLEHLDLTDSKLTNLHLGYTPNLKKVILSHSKLKTIYLRLTPNLKSLNLKNCYDLVDINAPVGNLERFAFLNLSCCGRFKSFEFHKQLDSDEVASVSELYLEAEPTDVCPLHCDNDYLKLQFSGFLIDSASSCGIFEWLISVGFSASINHESFSRSISSLLGIKKLTLQGSFTEAPLDQLECLEELNLVDVNAPVGNLKKLAFVDLSCCGRFKSFVYDKELDSDEVGFCASINHESFSRSISSLQGIKKLTLEGSLTEAPWDLDQLECLEELIFSSTKIRDLPDSICKLKHLKSFKIRSCWLLEKLPTDIGRLESLEKLILNDCKLLQDIPNSICKMKCINSFDLRGCIRVVELAEDIGCLEGLKELNIQLPEDIGRLESLEKLILRDCKLLQDIPNSICKVNCIKKLSLRGCIRVVELPEDIGCLEGLKELNIQGTGITRLPQSIFQLRAIRRSDELEAISNQRTTVSRVNSDQVVQEAIATRLGR
ncbi:disease resistance TIR-NBS-LRR class family protein [Tanacetum coccineum]